MKLNDEEIYALLEEIDQFEYGDPEYPLVHARIGELSHGKEAQTIGTE